jgi:hypothetical protein
VRNHRSRSHFGWSHHAQRKCPGRARLMRSKGILSRRNAFDAPAFCPNLCRV